MKLWTLGYADDVTFFAREKEDNDGSIKSLKEARHRSDKTKVMEFRK